MMRLFFLPLIIAFFAGCTSLTESSPITKIELSSKMKEVITMYKNDVKLPGPRFVINCYVSNELVDCSSVAIAPSSGINVPECNLPDGYCLMGSDLIFVYYGRGVVESKKGDAKKINDFVSKFLYNKTGEKAVEKMRTSNDYSYKHYETKQYFLCKSCINHPEVNESAPIVGKW
jgi:hypothetical protein